MARRLGAKKNKVELQDNLSDSKLGLYYRMPTTEEMTAYSNGLVQRKGNKLKRQIGEMRQKFGAKILIGIAPDSFEKEVGNEWLPVISDSANKDYDKDWNAIVCKQAPDIIEALAIHVFEASVQMAIPDDEDVSEN